MPGGILDLEKHYAFYGAYHNDKVNKVLHIVCVWPLLFTALVLLACLPYALPQPSWLAGLPWHKYFVLNLAGLAAAGYAAFYLVLEPKAGTLAVFLLLGCFLGANAVVTELGVTAALKVSVLVQVLGWGAQFLGHGLFERRRPALLDNLAQALLTAPFFVLLEVLDMLGYEPWPGFQNRVHAAVEADIREYRRQQGAKHKKHC